MSSAGVMSGRTPWALLGVKGAGLGRRGGVPGVAPFMAARRRRFRVKTGSSLRSGARLPHWRRLFAACTMGLGLCKNHVWPAARAFGREYRPPAKPSSFSLLVSYMPLALIWQPWAAQKNAADNVSLMEP